MTSPPGPARRISLTAVTLLTMVPALCAVIFAAYLVNRAYTAVDDSTQRLYDTHTEMVFDSMRQVRALERLQRSGTLLLKSDSAALRADLRDELESIRIDGVVQGSETTRQVVTNAFAVLDRCLMRLERYGARTRNACLDDWREPEQALVDAMESVSAQASTSLVTDLDSIVATAQDARTLSLVAGAVGVGALLLMFVCGYLLIGRPLLHVTRLLSRAQDSERVEPRTSMVREIQLLDDAAVSLAQAHRQLHEARSELEQVANTDLLTGLANRRSFAMTGALECDRSKRDQSSVALVCMDIDYFKSINDRFGHEGGDAALRTLAGFLKQAVRTIDFPARLGGEEFAIIMPRTHLDEAVQVAERLRASLAALPVVMPDGQTIFMTSSFGIATLRAGEPDLQGAMLRADTALYRAKDSGRNRVETAA